MLCNVPGMPGRDSFPKEIDWEPISLTIYLLIWPGHKPLLPRRSEGTCRKRWAAVGGAWGETLKTEP